MQAIPWLCRVNIAMSSGKWSNCWKRSLFRVLSKYHTVGICDPFVVRKGCPGFEFLRILPDESRLLSGHLKCPWSVLGGSGASCLKHPCCPTVLGPSKEAI